MQWRRSHARVEKSAPNGHPPTMNGGHNSCSRSRPTPSLSGAWSLVKIRPTSTGTERAVALLTTTINPNASGTLTAATAGGELRDNWTNRSRT